MEHRTKKVFIAGMHGMVGSILGPSLIEAGYPVIAGPTSKELDLSNQKAVEDFFAREKPDTVILAAAKVGGIQENLEHPVDFLQTNLSIQINVMAAAHRHGAARLLFLASSAVYPKDAAQPVQEEALLSGPLDAANEAYALAKIAGIRLCQAYVKQYGRNYTSLIPANLYGSPGEQNSSRTTVISSLIIRLYQAKLNKQTECVIWGTGNVLREFLHVRDLASAVLVVLDETQTPDIINIGSGEEISIRSLAEKIADEVGYRGRLVFDSARPEGVARKLLDSSRIRNFGWKPDINLDQGLHEAFSGYLKGLEA